MAGIRRAFLLTSLERYVVLATNFAGIAIISRLLTPAEVGLAVLGTSLLAVAETLRDFGTASYLIQGKDADTERVRTAFTMMALVSGVIVAILLLAAGPLAYLYGEERLAPFLRVIALGFLAGPISAPILALLRRDMAFHGVVVVNVVSGLTGTAMTVTLAALGHGYMSVAWGGLALNISAALLALAVRRDTSIFRFRLTEWRSALLFGGTNTATAILNRLYDVLPYLALGHMQPAATVGLFNRAILICQLPERVLLSGVVGVALPALAAEARAGRPLALPYLRALGYITAVQWPALVLVGLLAHPGVEMLFGSQWGSIVPVVQLICIAQLFAFPAPLTYPVLVAAGALRDTLTSSLITLPPSAILLLVAASHGVEALAIGLILAVPLQVGVALIFIRRRLRFDWQDLGRAVARSALVAAGAASGPLAAIALHGFRMDLPLGLGVLGGIGGVLGWAAALWLLRHPLWAEVLHVAAGLRTRGHAGVAAAHRRPQT